MTIWEVFVQTEGGDPFEHVGQVEAPNGDTATLAAKEHFARRDPCAGLWVIDRDDVRVASWPPEVLASGRRKVYRRSLGRGAPDDILAGRL